MRLPGYHVHYYDFVVSPKPTVLVLNIVSLCLPHFFHWISAIYKLLFLFWFFFTHLFSQTFLGVYNMNSICQFWKFQFVFFSVLSFLTFLFQQWNPTFSNYKNWIISPQLKIQILKKIYIQMEYHFSQVNEK